MNFMEMVRMSNRYWKPNETVAQCDLDDKRCLYPTGYCSMCPKENPNSSHEVAEIWQQAKGKNLQNELADAIEQKGDERLSEVLERLK